jgi:hypothetical protein
MRVENAKTHIILLFLEDGAVWTNYLYEFIEVGIRAERAPRGTWLAACGTLLFAPAQRLGYAFGAESVHALRGKKLGSEKFKRNPNLHCSHGVNENTEAHRALELVIEGGARQHDGGIHQRMGCPLRIVARQPKVRHFGTTTLRLSLSQLIEAIR